MTDRTFDTNQMLTAAREAFAPMLKAQQEGFKTIERLARLQYAVAGDVLETGFARMNAAFAAGTAYVAANRYQLDDERPLIYKTSDFGKTWKLLVHGIPDHFFTRTVREDPARKGLLYAGTESAVYVSFDDGDRWAPLQLNMPTCSVRDLVIHGDDLVAATYGRAFWVLDDLT